MNRPADLQPPEQTPCQMIFSRLTGHFYYPEGRLLKFQMPRQSLRLLKQQSDNLPSLSFLLPCKSVVLCCPRNLQWSQSGRFAKTSPRYSGPPQDIRPDYFLNQE